MNRWNVESGFVKKGDLLKRVIRDDFIADDDDVKKLSDVSVKELRKAGYKVWRFPENPKEKHE